MSGKAGWLGAFGVVLAALALCAAVLAPGASAELKFCPPGSGVGQCSTPEGVATDFESGRAFVAERGNHRVSAFKAETGEFLFAYGWDVNPSGGSGQLETCTTATGCQAGIPGTGAGQLSSPRWIAIDNIVGIHSTRHHVYVTDSNNRVSHFDEDGNFVNAIVSIGECQLGGGLQPVSVGPGGNVFVSGNNGSEVTVMKFSPAGACLGETVVIKGSFQFGALAVNSEEDAYVSVEGSGAVLRKYDLAVPESEPLCNLDPGIETFAASLDDAGHLFGGQREDPAKKGGTYHVVTEYDGCDKVRRFGYGKRGRNALGIAPLHTATGDVVVSEEGGEVNYIASSGGPAPVADPGPIAIAESLEAISVGNSQAIVRAEANPEGKATSVRVEYVTDADFQADVGDGGDGFEGPETKSTETLPLPVPAGREYRSNWVDFELGCPVATKELIEEGKCLIAETKYHWRVIAANADNPTGGGEGTAVGPQFTTQSPILATWASAVDTTTATLNGVVDPRGNPLVGYFEYVDDASFQESGFAEAAKAPTPSFDFGEGNDTVKRSVTLFPLEEGTTYHYRLVAINPVIEEEQANAPKTFRTFRKPDPDPCPANAQFRHGASELLPDCRAYELVSPLDKSNGDIVVLLGEGTSLPAMLDQSSSSGGRFTYGSYRAFGDAKSSSYTSQYLGARDPEQGWQSHGITPQQGHLIKGTFTFDFEFRAFDEELCEGWLVPLAEPPLAEGAEPGNLNLYRRTDEDCGGESYEAFTRAKPENLTRQFTPELQGQSADHAVAAFMANDTLEGSGAPAQPPACSGAAPGNCHLRLYVQAEGGTPRYACILPGEVPHEGSCSAGTSVGTGPFGRNRAPNVSNALSADDKRLFWSDSVATGRIYLRENPLADGPECVEPSFPCTKEVSRAGEEASGTASSRFWMAAEDGSVAVYSTDDDLYEYDVEGESTQLVAGGFKGVMGASEDASRVYFASTEALSGEEENSEGDKAIAGQPNLYLYEGAGGGSYRFIATLANADVSSTLTVGQSSATALRPDFRSSRVTADGAAATFMSVASLTDYDNTDAASGKADNEVFVYDAEAGGGAGELVCASCNPSGARPAGADLDKSAFSFWVAARLPVFQTTLFASRVLAEDGQRLFFESQDALVPRDTNSRVDVYQWERVGKGECSEDDATFSEQASGCVDLISSGQSVRDVEFLDASPSGNDVFFGTLSSLLPEDYGLVDVYDARIGGGFPSPPPPSVECEGETCQSPPAPPAFQAPATVTNEGPGNLAPPKKSKPKKCPKGKHKVKQGGKVRCVKDGAGKGGGKRR